tara:strand:+ start:5810 stop:7213 length:1404 start_codon:yes stop_codon:yes gene_type:complete
MYKVKPRIYFLIETKKREFDSRIYFATKAAASGFSVVIAKKSAIFDRRKDLQRGLIIFKSIGDKNVESLKEYKKLGYMIGAVDEEGMMFFNEKHYCESRYIKNLNLVDVFFCWGKKEYNAIINSYPEFKDKVFITGNQRIDVLKKKINEKYIQRSKVIKKKHGDFILFASMFTMANHKMADSDNKNLANIIDGFVKRGWSRDSDFIKLHEDYINFQKENMKLSIEFIKQFPNKFPNKKLIIRPHPNEKVEIWFELAKNLKNVEVVFDDESTSSWIAACNFIITSNCTTSIESFMLNKKSINLINKSYEKNQFLAPKLVSKNIFNLEDLNKTVENFNPVFDEIEKDNINIELSKIIYNCSDKICSAENMIKIINNKIENYKESNKDRFENIFNFYLFQTYYLIRYYYRKFFTKQDKVLVALITQKLKKIYSWEIKNTANSYLSSLQINQNSLKIKEIYPQIFKIENKL